MTRLKANLAMSLDGYVAGPDQSLEDPLGEGGMQLHEWVFELAAWREPTAWRAATSTPPRAVDRGVARRTSAPTIMGRNMFGGDPRALGRRAVERLVGRRSAVPRPGVRAHAPRARAARDGGRHHLPLRHRRHRVGARAGAWRRPAARTSSLGGGAERRPAVPGGGPGRRAAAATSCPSCSAAASGCSTASARRRPASSARVLDAPGVTHLKYRLVKP